MASGGKKKGRRKRSHKSHDSPVRKVKRKRAAAREAVERKEQSVARERAELEEIKADAAALGFEVPAEVREQIAEHEARVASEEAVAASLRAELAEAERRADDFLAGRRG